MPKDKVPAMKRPNQPKRILETEVLESLRGNLLQGTFFIDASNKENPRAYISSFLEELDLIGYDVHCVPLGGENSSLYLVNCTPETGYRGKAA